MCQSTRCNNTENDIDNKEHNGTTAAAVAATTAAAFIYVFSQAVNITTDIYGR